MHPARASQQMTLLEPHVPAAREHEGDDVHEHQHDEGEGPAPAAALDLLRHDVAQPRHVPRLDGRDALLHGVARRLLERRDPLGQRLLDVRDDALLERVDAALALLLLARELVERHAHVVVDADHLVLEVVLQVLQAPDEVVEPPLDGAEARGRDRRVRRRRRRRRRGVRGRGRRRAVRPHGQREHVVVVGELPRRGRHADVRAPQPRAVERRRSATAAHSTQVPSLAASTASVAAPAATASRTRELRSTEKSPRFSW